MTRADGLAAHTAVMNVTEKAASKSELIDVVLQHYNREHISLRRYLALIGMSAAAAQDIVQETFLRLQKHLAADGNRDNLRAWLYRVAHNLARNEQGSANTRSTVALEDGHCEIGDECPNSSPEAQMLVRERETALQNAIRALSPAQRECLVLRAQGMKYREIAAALDVSVASVGENIQRGLEKLKDLL
jgi:RNA polymerase sigma-70 factor (ECF subfamily)